MHGMNLGVRIAAVALGALLFASTGCATAARKTSGETNDQKAIKIQIDDYLKRISLAQEDGRKEDMEKYVSDLEATVHENFALILTLMQRGTLEDKVIAAGALGFSRDRSVLPYLLDTLKAETPPDLRRNALGSIGFLGSPTTDMEPLLASLADRNPEIRAGTAYAIGRVIRPGDDRGSLGPLLKALDDEDWRVRNNAAVALMNSGAREAAGTLILKGLRDTQLRVRVNAALALGELNDPAAVEPLVEALQSEDTILVHAANESLQKLTGQKFGRSYPLWKDWWENQKSKEAEAESRQQTAPQAPPDAPK